MVFFKVSKVRKSVKTESPEDEKNGFIIYGNKEKGWL